MASLEHAVTNEEARLGDFKRSTVREALSLKVRPNACSIWSPLI